MNVAYDNGITRLLQGDVREVLASMEAESVSILGHCGIIEV